MDITKISLVNDTGELSTDPILYFVECDRSTLLIAKIERMHAQPTNKVNL